MPRFWLENVAQPLDLFCCSPVVVAAVVVTTEPLTNYAKISCQLEEEKKKEQKKLNWNAACDATHKKLKLTIQPHSP